MASTILAQGAHFAGVGIELARSFVNNTWESNTEQSWDVITNDKGERFHQLKYNRDVYPLETPDWALVKTFAITYFGTYYFGFRCARHTAQSIYQAAQAAFQIWPNYKTLKMEKEFNFKIFLKGELHQFEGAKKYALQALKEFACFIPFYFNPYGICSYVQWGALAYTAYNPLMARVYWNKVESWVKVKNENIPISPREAVIEKDESVSSPSMENQTPLLTDKVVDATLVQATPLLKKDESVSSPSMENQTPLLIEKVVVATTASSPPTKPVQATPLLKNERTRSVLEYINNITDGSLSFAALLNMHQIETFKKKKLL